MAKLKNNSGKTILMALVFLLVAIMISLVLVIAAVDSARVLSNDRKYQQSALTVTSAAELLKDSLEINDLVKTETWKYEDQTYARLVADGYSVVWSSEGVLNSFLSAGVKHFEDGAGSDYVQSFNIDCSGFETVYVEMSMKKGETVGTYSLELQFSLGEDTPYNYSVVLSSNGTTNSNEPVKTVTPKPGGGNYGIITKTTTVKWGSVSIKGVRNSEEG